MGYRIDAVIQRFQVRRSVCRKVYRIQ